jgi:hypothetical protein
VESSRRCVGKSGISVCECKKLYKCDCCVVVRPLVCGHERDMWVCVRSGVSAVKTSTSPVCGKCQPSCRPALSTFAAVVFVIAMRKCGIHFVIVGSRGCC